MKRRLRVDRLPMPRKYPNEFRGNHQVHTTSMEQIHHMQLMKRTILMSYILVHIKIIMTLKDSKLGNFVVILVNVVTQHHIVDDIPILIILT